MKLLIGLCAALAVAAGVQSWRWADERADHANTKANHAQALKAASDSARKAVEDDLKKLQAQTATIQGALDANLKELDKANSDARASADAGERLRRELAAARARSCPTSQTPATTPSGPTADPTGDLLDRVQRRLDEAQNGIAAFADRSRSAGLVCERYADALE